MRKVKNGDKIKCTSGLTLWTDPLYTQPFTMAVYWLKLSPPTDRE